MLAVTTADTLFRAGQRDLEPSLADIGAALVDGIEAVLLNAVRRWKHAEALIDHADQIAAQAGARSARPGSTPRGVHGPAARRRLEPGRCAVGAPTG